MSKKTDAQKILTFDVTEYGANVSASSPAQVVALFKDYEKLGTVSEFYRFINLLGESVGMQRAGVAATITYPLEVSIVASAGARLPEKFDDQVREGIEAVGSVLGDSARSEHLIGIYFSRKFHKRTCEAGNGGSDADAESASDQDAAESPAVEGPSAVGEAKDVTGAGHHSGSADGTRDDRFPKLTAGMTLTAAFDALEPYDPEAFKADRDQLGARILRIIDDVVKHMSIFTAAFFAVMRKLGEKNTQIASAMTQFDVMSAGKINEEATQLEMLAGYQPRLRAFVVMFIALLQAAQPTAKLALKAEKALSDFAWDSAKDVPANFSRFSKLRQEAQQTSGKTINESQAIELVLAAMAKEYRLQVVETEYRSMVRLGQLMPNSRVPTTTLADIQAIAVAKQAESAANYRSPVKPQKPNNSGAYLGSKFGVINGPTEVAHVATSSDKCFNCGKNGHYARDCKSPSKRTPPKQFGGGGGGGGGGQNGAKGGGQWGGGVAPSPAKQHEVVFRHRPNFFRVPGNFPEIEK